MNRLFYSDKCPQTEPFMAQLDQHQIPYEAININESIANLKQFLQYRDQRNEFDAIRQTAVGVPLLIDASDHLYFDVQQAVEQLA